MALTSEQCRAGRALLGWSQDQLAERSGASKRSIAEFERSAGIPYRRTLQDLEEALEAAGVQLIPENGGGAGVRLKRAVARMVRKRVSRFDRVATIMVAYRSKEFRVTMPTDILDDMDRTNHPDDAAMEKAVERYQNRILIRAAGAIEAGRADERGNVELTAADFPEVG
ncbi:helix-turn-helix domain-containing protein [Dongia sedimenti]|uniref:Helix-turn-helix transcriptional regulator n=1 Tax=Dongia sedimenti TaxID=3064282 RepID=A0ABU0YWQ7_9PROT|nr:helix-turn-helix transcriptional regulator [Rhodospirillaceae bacterium R-7]